MTDMIQPITGIASGQFQILGLVFLRMASFLAVAPITGSVSVPVRVRIGLAMVLALLIFPTLPKIQFDIPTALPGFAMLALREIFVGLIAGWVFSMVFMAMEVAGALVDSQAGYAMVELMDPNTGDSTHLFGQFLVIAATVAFMAAGLHMHVVEVLVQSFKTVPLAMAKMDIQQFWPVALHVTAEAILTGVRLAGPMLMALLMVTIVMAVVSRIMPAMNTWIMALPLQIVTACLVVAFGLPQILSAFRAWEETVFQSVFRLLAGMT